MALPSGTRFGPYEIVGALGAGGMGEVYKARDTRLNRTVAIKVLPEHLTDTESRARFEREARAISSLDHPNICALYDVGQHDDAYFIVMQFLAGQTLADRLARGPVPIDQALRIAIEIAGALEHAHRAGIVHRDLKPGNIMLTGSSARGAGAAKLLDFGLAKPQAVSTTLKMSASTRLAAAPVTAAGTILGTVRYMAPEQIEGKDADARSDIFALGVVLHEMITGVPPFDGPTPASIIGSILRDHPRPITERQPHAPATLAHVIERCIAKDPDDRWQTAADVRRELQWIQSTPTIAGMSVTSRPLGVSRVWRWTTIALAVAAAGLSIAVFSRLFSPPPADVARFQILAPPSAPFVGTGASTPTTTFTVSPDGHRIVFVAAGSGGAPTLWIRSLDAVQARMLNGTEDATEPFWSPDGRFVGFFAQRKLKKIDVTTGSLESLFDGAPDPRGGAWSRDDIILFAPSTNSGLEQLKVATGSVPSHALELRPGENSYRWPSFLPDGRHFVFHLRASSKPGIYLGSLDHQPPSLLIEGAPYNAVVSPAGYLLTMREGALLAFPFDLRQLRITGEPVRVADGVSGSSMQYASFSTSGDVLAYSAGLARASRLEWFDRAGKPLGVAAEAGDYSNFRLSPDGRQLAFAKVDPKVTTTDIWLEDLSRNVSQKFTSSPGTEDAPIWSPDGTRIVYRSDRSGGNFTWEKPVSAPESAAATQFAPFEAPFPTDWSPDQRYVLYQGPLGAGFYCVAVIDRQNTSKPMPIAPSQFMQMDGHFAPDGHWVAYAADVNGRMDIFVQAFPNSGGARQASTSGGTEPHWRRDGKALELYYLAPDSKMMRVPVTLGSSVEFGKPEVLFQTRAPYSPTPYRITYDVTADGSRFLIATPVEGTSSASINVVLNWLSDLRKK